MIALAALQVNFPIQRLFARYFVVQVVVFLYSLGILKECKLSEKIPKDSTGGMQVLSLNLSH